MYLESSSPKNNAYYKKFGFEAKKDIQIGGTAVALTIMVREPQRKLNAGAHHSSVIPIKLSGNFNNNKVMREKTAAD